MATTIPAPRLYYNINLVKKLGKWIAGTDGWQACTVPPGIPAIPPGVYFTQAKKDVATKLFKHEFYHWGRGCKMGGGLYMLTLAYQYRVYGYKKAPDEVAANEYAKSPLTPVEQGWVDASK